MGLVSFEHEMRNWKDKREEGWKENSKAGEMISEQE